MKLRVRSEHHGSEVNGHHVGYWIGFVDTRVLLERNNYSKVLVKPQRYDSMIDMNQGVHLAENE
jgi:hypothetical protein